MSRYKSLFLLCAILPIVLSQCTRGKVEIQFRRSVYEFSIELLSRIAQDTDAHFISSTLSPWTLLTTVSLGAAEETLAELKRVLKLRHQCFTNKYLEIVKEVTASDPKATLERSSSLFIDDAMQLKEPFRRKLAETGVSEITAVYFDDFAAAASVINNYVKQATHGVIEDIVEPNDLEGAYFILIDALYFKGSWRKAFANEETEISAFYDSQRNVLGDVSLMFTKGAFNVTSIDQIRAKVLELPYGDSSRFSMLLFLPYEDVTIYSVIDSLKKISLNSIFTMFRNEGPQTVLVQIPRFKITSDLDNLKELLSDMGLHDTFDSMRARFPDITNFSVHVSSFIQKADIEVTETGTVAAAVTQVEFSYRTAIIPEEFLANKPFLFMVVDRQNEVPVFSGAYSKPTVY